MTPEVYSISSYVWLWACLGSLSILVNGVQRRHHPVDYIPAALATMMFGTWMTCYMVWWTTWVK